MAGETSAAAAATSTRTVATGGEGSEEKKKKVAATAAAAATTPPREEYNARSVGYLLIALGSLINLSSVSNLKNENNFQGNQIVGLSFGATTFGLSLLFLIVDRTGALDTTQALGGKFEGATLLCFTLWWTGGVGYLTQVRGIAYSALNVYASAWLTWALCIQTLNQWSASKDILTIDEITGISETLKSWYVLALSSMVVTGSSIDFWFKTTALYADDAVFTFCLSLFSTILALGWILTHMNFITSCQEGGWMEASSAWLAILVWIVNCAVLTRDGGIGATIIGTQYRWTSTTERALEVYYPFELAVSLSLTNCSLVWNTLNDGESLSTLSAPIECPLDQGIPGSNLYMACWISLGAAINIALRWNAQRALELAQPTTRHQGRVASSSRQKPATTQNNAMENDDEDLEDFTDANAY